MEIDLNGEQIATWLILLLILYALISEKIRFDAAAFSGLLLLGLLQIAPPSTLFSGFSSPALFTVAIVLVMSAGIVESGILNGFGKSIARRIKKPKNQILTLLLATTVVSGFVNNVGTVGIMLPTSQRMAQRAGYSKANVGMALVYITILSGSVTLIGTASNLIVSTFRMQSLGEPFKMFDFAAHGLVMVGIAFIILFFCQVCGFNFGQATANAENKHLPDTNVLLIEPAYKRNPRKTRIVLLTLIPVIILTSIGQIHPAVGFGFVVFVWLGTGVLSSTTAYENINIPIILFLGSMLSIANILTDIGALQTVADLILPPVLSFPPFLLILSVLFVTALVSNFVDNSVSAVLMSPLVIQLYQTGAVAVTADALLMAVAAGASLAIVIPTHQATLVVMNSTGFSRKSFIKTGLMIALAAGICAALVINIVWN
ncbi:SLC13 family permease [Dehalobacterium formicoaceticum]|uniref:SLC13 family permease n=1 Tax=Dehalobacterium formicoaceticum TaxID=51515 RepID=A0ABT1Y045_9FIRM|nr:SLC13 family permease [Dehalobacterium formicoaceticum]MCR6544244.1 SLC13 family permease [Dehalobacterium formicoaceticum]